MPRAHVEAICSLISTGWHPREDDDEGAGDCMVGWYVDNDTYA